ncbi:MAG: M4 family metallopeptidase [Candidatus Eremiobacteraeota bacterium]|nr:M4 family metallopeptidase [Candidatus Eremiobacteraeota bacterium]MBC5802049.1 M4 family metallopeptidase [Candidatus Eremiobacteraeota bacterium]MBC5823180.1 M4 family metallopeptidase [Candidatus Eremiobacteraeota bacterium]
MVRDGGSGDVPRCSIVPPYVLEALAQAGDARLARAGHQTILLTAELAERRLLLLERGERHLADERRVVYDAVHGRELPGTLLRREGGPACADASANAAYEHAGQTFSFFERVFGRSSIDGRGMRLLSSVHYGQHYDNAFWDGTEMVYGDGDGVVLGDFTRALDVIAHELTHGLTESTANLTYSGQSGALNESVSDVFGSLVKQWVHGQRAEEADWLIGDRLLVDTKFGRALRSLAAPGTAYNSIFMGGKDPQPAHMRDYQHMRADDGGVHVNSGIPNHAFYLLAVDLGGHAWERAGAIWFGALTGAARPHTSFAEFASETVHVAEKQFGDEVRKHVQHAWQRVGVSA